MPIFRTPIYGHAFLKSICVLATLVFGINLAALAAPMTDCCAVTCCGHCMPVGGGATEGMPLEGYGCHGNGSASCHASPVPFEGDGSRPMATALSAAPDVKFSACTSDRQGPMLWGLPAVQATARANGIARSLPLYLSYGILIC